MTKANPDDVAYLSSKITVGNKGRRTRVGLPSINTLRDYHKQVKNRREDFSIEEIIGDFIPNSVSASTKPFVNLSPVSLRDLYLEQHSEGNYVLVRILESGIEVVGWLWVIEDDQGNGCILNVFNYPRRELFCVGTVLIIKEPLLMVTANGIPFIRCDCPSDIIVLWRSHPLYLLAEDVEWKNGLGKIERHEYLVLHHPLTVSAQTWLSNGEALFRRGYSSLALESYLLGLKCCRDDIYLMRTKIHSNLCVVYLDLGYYEKTIATSRLVPNDVNAVLSAARAYYRLRKYQEASDEYWKIISKRPSDFKIRKEYARCLHRLREQASGFWAIHRLIRDSRYDQLKKLDYGDYIGPVEVVDMPGEGRGVVLTHDVNSETVLIVSKAFAATLDMANVFRSALPSDNVKSCNSHRNSLNLQSEIAEAVFKNPQTFGALVYDLSTGVVPHQEVQLFCDSVACDEPICDTTIIKAIYNCNNFTFSNKLHGRMENVGTGLFIYPSYLKHSGRPNVYATFYNDVMVVRSIGRLKAGVQLYINHAHGQSSFRTPTTWLHMFM